MNYTKLLRLTHTTLRHRRYTSSSQPSPPSLLIDEFTRHCYNGDLPSALSAMSSLEKHNLWADPITYSHLIKHCSVSQAKLVHTHLFSNGHKPKTFLINILVNMYVKFHLIDDALKLFDEMPERNVVSYTTVISGYVKLGNGGKAMELMVSMMRDGVSPNAFTYSCVLRACQGLVLLKQLQCGIIKVGLDSDVFVRSSLIDNYSKWGELGDAKRVFDEMVTGDLVVWNSIIGGFAQNADGDGTLGLFNRMKTAGFSADQSTLTSVLRACTGLALLELGSQVHVHVLKFQRDLILNNALLDMYCKCGSLEDANTVFIKMAERDVISWSTIIMGFAQNGFSIEALELFKEMKSSGTKPNYITILGVLFACSHAGLVEDGENHFKSMKNLFGIEPGREHYGCMVDLLGRAGRIEEAVKLIQEMECEPDAITWRTLLSACRVHHNSDIAVYAAKQIIKLDPDDTGTYILLSNIYANSQRWEDVTQVRRSMRDHGLKKEPGCSWIEVDKQIHAFILGDSSHPRIESINNELGRLIQRLKELGYVPDTSFVLQDLEGEQREASLFFHCEKLAIVFGLMSLSREKTIRIRKNLRICGDCHVFAKLLAKMEQRNIVIRDPIRYHHFSDGVCSCRDYW